ncbi:TPA: hypothetical protein N0F65_011632 [Lagenidium giganteum]|uniref:RING-type domain-containing protein n=1 Tax=Lagenidium giganteum TaxID=4803 RepID=A0AAV2ZDN5_9STRA|nr:TPA: hypothetical protein N0F65_011632 [Lagenidium giganteum]
MMSNVSAKLIFNCSSSDDELSQLSALEPSWMCEKSNGDADVKLPAEVLNRERMLHNSESGSSPDFDRFSPFFEEKGLPVEIRYQLPLALGTANETDKECTICQLRYGIGDHIVTLPCQHFFQTEVSLDSVVEPAGTKHQFTECPPVDQEYIRRKMRTQSAGFRPVVPATSELEQLHSRVAAMNICEDESADASELKYLVCLAYFLPNGIADDSPPKRACPAPTFGSIGGGSSLLGSGGAFRNRSSSAAATRDEFASLLQVDAAPSLVITPSPSTASSSTRPNSFLSELGGEIHEPRRAAAQGNVGVENKQFGFPGTFGRRGEGDNVRPGPFDLPSNHGLGGLRSTPPASAELPLLRPTSVNDPFRLSAAAEGNTGLYNTPQLGSGYLTTWGMGATTSKPKRAPPGLSKPDDPRSVTLRSGSELLSGDSLLSSPSTMRLNAAAPAFGASGLTPTQPAFGADGPRDFGVALRPRLQNLRIPTEVYSPNRNNKDLVELNQQSLKVADEMDRIEVSSNDSNNGRNRRSAATPTRKAKTSRKNKSPRAGSDGRTEERGDKGEPRSEGSRGRTPRSRGGGGNGSQSAPNSATGNDAPMEPTSRRGTRRESAGSNDPKKSPPAKDDTTKASPTTIGEVVQSGRKKKGAVTLETKSNRAVTVEQSKKKGAPQVGQDSDRKSASEPPSDDQVGESASARSKSRDTTDEKAPVRERTSKRRERTTASRRQIYREKQAAKELAAKEVELLARQEEAKKTSFDAMADTEVADSEEVGETAESAADPTSDPDDLGVVAADTYVETTDASKPELVMESKHSPSSKGSSAATPDIDADISLHRQSESDGDLGSDAVVALDNQSANDSMEDPGSDSAESHSDNGASKALVDQEDERVANPPGSDEDRAEGGQPSASAGPSDVADNPGQARADSAWEGHVPSAPSSNEKKHSNKEHKKDKNKKDKSEKKKSTVKHKKEKRDSTGSGKDDAVHDRREEKPNDKKRPGSPHVIRRAVRSLGKSVLGRFVSAWRSTKHGCNWVLDHIQLRKLCATAFYYLESFLAVVFSVILLLSLHGASWFIHVHRVAFRAILTHRHIGFCFVFLYAFPFLVQYVFPWAPPWAPVCLWYAFLVQLFCTSGPTAMVTTFRIILPLVFLVEGISHHSFLLDLNGAELLLASFILSAMKTSNFCSPIFFLSLAAQCLTAVFLGSELVVQWLQMALALYSLHSMAAADEEWHGVGEDEEEFGCQPMPMHHSIADYSHHPAPSATSVQKTKRLDRRSLASVKGRRIR